MINNAKFNQIVLQLNNYGKTNFEEISFIKENGTLIPIATKKPNWFKRLVRWIFHGGYKEAKIAQKVVDFLKTNNSKFQDPQTIDEQKVNIVNLKKILLGRVKNLQKKQKIDLQFAEIIDNLDHLKTESPLTTSTAINKKIDEMECHFFRVKIMANQLTRPHLQIPLMTYSKDKVQKASQKIRDCVNHLRSRYGHELEDQEYHGRLSHQRIIWQDEKFIELIQDREAVEAIFVNASLNTEIPLTSSGYTLSSMILYGLSSNMLSYLLKVTPNWHAAKFPSPNVTAHTLKKVQEGIKNIDSILSSIVVVADLNEFKAEQQVLRSTAQQLYQMIVLYLKDIHKAEEVAKGVSLATGLEAMNQQCLMSMQDFKVHAQTRGLVKALNMGIFSHLLDAKHLAAAIAYFETPEKLSEQQIANQALLKELLAASLRESEEVFGITIDEEARELMRSKFQQIMLIIIEKCKETNDETMLKTISEAL